MIKETSMGMLKRYEKEQGVTLTDEQSVAIMNVLPTMDSRLSEYIIHINVVAFSFAMNGEVNGSIFHGMTPVGYFEGHPIYHAELLLQAMGISCVGIITGQDHPDLGAIMVDNSFMMLSQKSRDFMLHHEIAHIALNHYVFITGGTYDVQKRMDDNSRESMIETEADYHAMKTSNLALGEVLFAMMEMDSCMKNEWLRIAAMHNVPNEFGLELYSDTPNKELRARRNRLRKMAKSKQLA